MRDILPGGKSDNIPPSRFPPKKVTQGAKVESEHSSNPVIAREIARDHLSEDMNYYEKLRKMEKTSGIPRGLNPVGPMREKFVRHVLGHSRSQMIAGLKREGINLGKSTHGLKKISEAKVDGFLDEMSKISSLMDKLVEKGTKLGDFAVKHPKTSLGVLGGTLSGLSAAKRESWERHQDNRAKLTDEEKKKLRRERLLNHHLPSVASGAAIGASIPWAAKFVRNKYPDAMRSGMKNMVSPASEGVAEGVAEGASNFVKKKGTRLSQFMLNRFLKKSV